MMMDTPVNSKQFCIFFIRLWVDFFKAIEHNISAPPPPQYTSVADPDPLVRGMDPDPDPALDPDPDPSIIM